MYKSEFVAILDVKGENNMSKKNETSKFVALEYDHDASLKTWNECYKKIYNENVWDFWGMFDYENLKKLIIKLVDFMHQL